MNFTILLLLSVAFGLNAADFGDQEKKAGKRSADHLDSIEFAANKKKITNIDREERFQDIITFLENNIPISTNSYRVKSALYRLADAESVYGLESSRLNDIKKILQSFSYNNFASQLQIFFKEIMFKKFTNVNEDYRYMSLQLKNFWGLVLEYNAVFLVDLWEKYNNEILSSRNLWAVEETDSDESDEESSEVEEDCLAPALIAAYNNNHIEAVKLFLQRDAMLSEYFLQRLYKNNILQIDQNLILDSLSIASDEQYIDAVIPVLKVAIINNDVELIENILNKIPGCKINEVIFSEEILELINNLKYDKKNKSSLDYFFNKKFDFFLHGKQYDVIIGFCCIYQNECFDRLLKSGIDWNTIEYGNLLKYAINTNNLDLIKYVCYKYPDLSTKENIDKGYFLGYIIARNLNEIAEYMINNMSIDYGEISESLWNGKSILEHVCVNKNIKICKLLIAKYPQLLQKPEFVGTYNNIFVKATLIEKIITDKNTEFNFLLDDKYMDIYLNNNPYIERFFCTICNHKIKNLIQKTACLIKNDYILYMGLYNVIINSNGSDVSDIVDIFLSLNPSIAIRNGLFLPNILCDKYPHITSYILDITLKLNVIGAMKIGIVSDNINNLEKFIELCVKKKIDRSWILSNMICHRQYLPPQLEVYRPKSLEKQKLRFNLAWLKAGMFDAKHEEYKKLLSAIINCMPEQLKKNIDLNKKAHELFEIIRNIIKDLILEAKMSLLLQWHKNLCNNIVYGEYFSPICVNKDNSYKKEVDLIIRIFFTENQIFNMLANLIESNKSNYIVEVFLRACPNFIKIRNLEGFNLLYVAIKSNNYFMVEMLIQEYPNGLLDVSSTKKDAFSILLNRSDLFSRIIRVAKEL